MYNVLIKDFASVNFNKQKDILTIKFSNKKTGTDKFSKLSQITNQFASGKTIIMIIDFSNTSINLSDIRNSYLSRLEDINITNLIIVAKSKLHNTLFNIFRPFSATNNEVNVQVVKSLEEAIRYTNELSLLKK